MASMSVAAPSKLPLWRTIGQAYALWSRNFSELIHVCWLWMLVMAPIMAVWMWWQIPALTEMMDKALSQQPFVDPHPLRTMLTQVLGQVIFLPALASVAVAWHRLLLRSEHPAPGPYLRFDALVIGYAILAFLIGLITLAPNYVSSIFQIATGTSASAQDVAALVVQTVAGLGTIVVFFVVARVSLALPAKALGRDDVTLGVAWRASRRNSWRMVWAYFFCILPWMAIGGIMSFMLFKPANSQVTIMLVWLVLSLLWIPAGMISVGMLSLAYRHFFERAT
jgi:hypothetical protein